MDIEDLTDTRISFEETRITKEGELSSAQSLSASVTATKTKNQATFDAQISEYNEATEAIDEALELLG